MFFDIERVWKARGKNHGEKVVREDFPQGQVMFDKLSILLVRKKPSWTQNRGYFPRVEKASIKPSKTDNRKNRVSTF